MPIRTALWRVSSLHSARLWMAIIFGLGLIVRVSLILTLRGAVYGGRNRTALRCLWREMVLMQTRLAKALGPLRPSCR